MLVKKHNDYLIVCAFPLLTAMVQVVLPIVAFVLSALISTQ